MPSPPQKARNQGWLALFLALVGGYVDAAGYIVLLKMFTAHMSGNSIAMTVYVGETNWREAFHRGFPIPVFVAGVAAGAALSEVLLRRGARSAYACPLGLEAILLTLFIAFGAAVYRDGALRTESDWTFYALAALPALAMGVQNSAMRRVGGIGVRTTYITGMLTNFAEEAVRVAFPPPEGRPWGRMGLYFGVWAAYIVGGVSGAVAELRWGLPCLFVPVAFLLAVAARDLARPLAPPKPPEQKPEWEL